VNDCQIDSCDHYSVRLNSEAASAEVGLSVADVVVVVVAMVATESEIETVTAEEAVRMGADYLDLNSP
jgi:hypothetical protein